MVSAASTHLMTDFCYSIRSINWGEGGNLCFSFCSLCQKSAQSYAHKLHVSHHICLESLISFMKFSCFRALRSTADSTAEQCTCSSWFFPSSTQWILTDDSGIAYVWAPNIQPVSSKKTSSQRNQDNLRTCHQETQGTTFRKARSCRDFLSMHRHKS